MLTLARETLQGLRFITFVRCAASTPRHWHDMAGVRED
jgi:hypothetical protein